MELRKDTALLLYCVVIGATVDAISRPSTMVLENNQFKNVVIAIHDSVTEDKSLIDTLKVGNLQSFFPMPQEFECSMQKVLSVGSDFDNLFWLMRRGRIQIPL